VFPKLRKVWFNPHFIANILSLAEVRKVCRVTMDTADEPAMIVHQLDGSAMTFLERACGLYVYDPSYASSRPVTAYTMVSTVTEQKQMFSHRNVHNTDVARQLYRMIGRPASKAKFLRMLSNGSLVNCPVTPLNKKRAHAI
jgi:hypothetical protein